MNVDEGLIAFASGLTAQQGVVAAGGVLLDVHNPGQKRDIAEHFVFVQRLMGIAPTPAFDFWTVALFEINQGFVQREAGLIGAGFFGRRLDHIAPDLGPGDVAIDPFNEERVEARQTVGQIEGLGRSAEAACELLGTRCPFEFR